MLGKRKTALATGLASLLLFIVLVAPAAATFIGFSMPSDFLGWISFPDCGGVSSTNSALCLSHVKVLTSTAAYDSNGPRKVNYQGLQSYVTSCTSANAEIKGLCMYVTATMKLFQEDTELIVPLPTTFDYLNSTGYTPEEVAWSRTTGDLAFIMLNDGSTIYDSDAAYAFGNLNNSTINAIPTTDTARFQSVSTAYQAVVDAGKAFKSQTDQPCFAAYSLIYQHAKADDVSSDNAPEIRSSLVACNQAVQASGRDFLTAISALDQAMGTTGGQGAAAQGAQGIGSVLTLPLPLGNLSLPGLISRVIRQVLSVVGALALAFFVWGGLLWMTAAGDAAKIAKGKKVIVAAIAGLTAIFASYAVLSLIISALSK